MSFRMTCKVYALFAKDDGEIRYIGQTIKPINVRLRQHINDAMRGRSWPLAKWIRKRIGQGDEIQAVILVQRARLNITEAQLIAAYRSNGARLLNCTDGGEGFVGYKPTTQHREALSAGAKRRAATPEGRDNASKAGKAMWAKPENARRRRIVRVRKSRSEAAKEWARDNPERFKLFQMAAIKTPEQNLKIAASVKQLWKDDEFKAKVLAGHAKYWTPERRAEQAERARNQRRYR